MNRIGSASALASATAPEPSLVPAATRVALQSATTAAGARATVSGSPAPTVMVLPGSHGLSEPPPRHVYEPSSPETASPPSAPRVAVGGESDRWADADGGTDRIPGDTD